MFVGANLTGMIDDTQGQVSLLLLPCTTVEKLSTNKIVALQDQLPPEQVRSSLTGLSILTYRTCFFVIVTDHCAVFKFIIILNTYICVCL